MKSMISHKKRFRMRNNDSTFPPKALPAHSKNGANTGPRNEASPPQIPPKDLAWKEKILSSGSTAETGTLLRKGCQAHVVLQPISENLRDYR